MTMALFPKGCLFFLLLASGSCAFGITARVEVLATAEDVEDYFTAAATEIQERLEVGLSPGVKWASLGRFRGYTLRVLPMKVQAETLAEVYWKYTGEKYALEASRKPTVQFSLKRERVPFAYIVVHFEGGRLEKTDMVEVCIPYVTFRTLVKKWPE